MIKNRAKWIINLLSCFVLWNVASASSHDGIVNKAANLESPKTRERFKILGAFGHPGKSHFDVFLPLLEELARRGHDVTVISYFPRDNETSPLTNYRDINLVRQASDVFVNVVDLHEIHHSAISLIKELLILRSWALNSCEYGLSHPKVLELIRSDEKFDLIITEGFNGDCFLGFVHRFKAPFISLSSHQIQPWINRRIANDDNPSYVPLIMTGFEPSMTFIQRLYNTVSLGLVKIAYELGTRAQEQAIVEKVFGPGVPSLDEIARNTSAVLVNTHYSLHGSKPDLPSVVEIGGIHISRNVRPLPIDLQRFLDDAREGVLFFSLGSMIKASSMPERKLSMIVRVIGSLPRKVIWKWEAEDMPDKPANLLVRKWLPQAAILSE